MTIFLTILKVIGIILLVLLGIVICLLLMILFIPVRYRIAADLKEDKRAKAAIHWLFHLVNVIMDYGDGRAIAYVRILFFKKILWQYPEPKKAKTDLEEEDLGQIASNPLPEDGDLEEADAELQEIIEQIEGSKAKQSENLHEPVDSETDVSVIQETFHKQHRRKKLRNPIEWVKSILHKVKQTITTVQNMLKDIKKTAKRVMREVSDERNQEAVLHIKDEILALLKVLLPKRFRIELEYSTGSPDTTGQILGILTLFPVGYTNRWHIYPDFSSDEFYIKGIIDVKGRIQVVWILAMVIRLIRDKNCRRLYRRIQK